MTDQTITIHCDGIVCNNKIVLPLPNGWYGSYESEDGGHWLYCGDCLIQSDWFSDQCPGCVESYPDCGLGKAFQYEHRRTINMEQLNKIENGICPFRINGTFGFSSAGVERIDLSSPATTESGMAVADAIRLYIQTYPNKEK